MGVTVEVLVPGDGINFPKTGDKVTINYVGKLKDGKVYAVQQLPFLVNLANLDSLGEIGSTPPQSVASHGPAPLGLEMSSKVCKRGISKLCTN